MVSGLLLVCVVWGGLLLVLTIAFDVMVYNRTKSFEYMLKTWMSRHNNNVHSLTKNESRLLNVVGKLERGLGYYGLLVVVPLLFLNTIFGG